MRKFVIVTAALVSLAACGGKSAHTPTQNRNLITADEIARSNASTAYEAVERLRPAFLRTRGPQSLQNSEPPTPNVYVDGMKYGTLASLAQLPALGIISIQYLSALDASQRFGIGNEGGAIVVTTKH
jgi:hypothetical protein